MTTLICPCCNGSGDETYHNLTAIDGDTSYDTIDCHVCGGAGRVPAAWAVAFEETGLETRCDHCRKSRPCAIMENPAGDIVIVCAQCAAAMETVSAVQEAAS